MPVMNGLEFLQRSRRNRLPGHPGHHHLDEGKEEDTIRGLKMGAKGYVKKLSRPPSCTLIEKVTSAAS